MRRTVSLVIGWLLAAATGAGAAYGGHAGATFRIGAGAQALGFGGAIVSLAQDPASILANPAGASYVVGGTFIASRTFLSGDRATNVLGFSRSFDRRAGFSIAWVSSEVTGVPGFDGDGNSTGNLKNGENLIAATFANRFGPVALGVTGKWFRHELDRRNTSGWVFDLGIASRPLPDLRIGVAVRDLVGEAIWTTERDAGQFRVEDKYPLTVAAGASYFHQRTRVIVAADVEDIADEGRYAHLGAAWTAIPRLRLRAGYRWLPLGGDAARDGTPTAGASFDTRFGMGTASIDYAVMSDPLGLIHSLGLRVAF